MLFELHRHVEIIRGGFGKIQYDVIKGTRANPCGKVSFEQSQMRLSDVKPTFAGGNSFVGGRVSEQGCPPDKSTVPRHIENFLTSQTNSSLILTLVKVPLSISSLFSVDS